jgi:D-glycero-alpha-D-manno-heptose-7-phosphate kinase
MKIKKGVEIHHDGDLPARSGLGSSSSFTVGLIHALYALRGQMPTKRQLALNAIHLEQEVMKENVGSQDQALSAFGGFNLIEFGGKRHLQVQPITINPERLELFQAHLMLFFTGFSRTASEIAAAQIKKTPYKKKELKAMLQIVNRALEVLNSNTSLSEFGRLLDENWQIKRSLSNKISTPLIDEIYSTALRAGALGGKLLGAGGGGFILIFAKPQVQPKIKEKLKKLLYVPFRLENLGSQIIFYSPGDSLINP